MILDLYTDGSCSGNPGPSGWGFLTMTDSATVYEKFGAMVREDGEFIHATNQQAELMACAKGFQWILENRNLHKMKGEDWTTVRLHSDSAYLLNCLKDRWYIGWMMRVDGNGHWLTSKGELVQNQWIWKLIITALGEIKKLGITVEFIKVKGHSGDRWNERVDQLARAGTGLSKEYFFTSEISPTSRR